MQNKEIKEFKNKESFTKTVCGFKFIVYKVLKFMTNFIKGNMFTNLFIYISVKF